MHASTPAATLLNATPVEVEYLNGQKETIPLRRLTIRELYQFTHLMAGDKIPELVGLCAARNGEWIDALTDQTFARLVKECVAQNFPRAMALAEADMAIARDLLTIKQTAQMVAILGATGKPSPASSPAPAPSASAAATGSASSTLPPSASAPSSPPPPASAPKTA